MKVPFLDIKEINNRFKTDLENEYNEVLRSGHFIHGPKYYEFCDNLKKYLGCGYCIGVGNGYDALFLLFKSLIQLNRLKVGDEVLVPSNTYIASATAISSNGLIPVFVEPDGAYNFNFHKAMEVCSERTKACLIVHLFGQTSWDLKFEDFCSENNILILEDCAQSIGATFGNRKTGNLGYAGAFSFYPGKNLGALGDGGAIVTNNEELYKTAQELANYGSNEKYLHNSIGLNSRLDELQAAFLTVKLKHLEEDNIKRKRISRQYMEGVKNKFICLPEIHNDHVFHLFVIRTKKRENLIRYLNEKNIQTLIHYPIAIPNQLAYKNHPQHGTINTLMHNEILSIPISPVMTKDEINWVIECLNTYNEQ